MKITTFEMPLNIARARARKWLLKANSIEFIYNANKTKARLLINTGVGLDRRELKQSILMDCLPQTQRGQKLSRLFKRWVASQKVQKRTIKQVYISEQNMRDFVESKPHYQYLGGLNQDFGEDKRRAGF